MPTPPHFHAIQAYIDRVQRQCDYACDPLDSPYYIHDFRDTLLKFKMF
jgi:hypothetical protein